MLINMFFLPKSTQILAGFYHFGVKYVENIHQIQLEETKKHGDVLFPFNIYPGTIPKDFPSVALHWHRNMELIYIKKGGLFCQVDMRNEAMTQGDICIVPPGTLHGLRGMDGEIAEYENIIFDPEMLGSGAADLCARQYLVPLAAGRLLHPLILRTGDVGYEDTAAILMETERLCADRIAGYELAVKASMMQMIFCLMQLQPEKPSAELPGTARLKQVLSHIQREYARPITVDEMAKFCSCSSGHFMRWFRQMTGSSFVAYLNEHRLAEAARKLRSSEEKILTIAQDVGFESLSNFNHQFRIRYGVTPREYRAGT